MDKELTPWDVKDIFNRIGNVEGVKSLLSDDGLAIKTPEGSIQKVEEVAVSNVQRFVAKDHLSEANVVWTSNGFNRLFLNKVEEDVKDGTIIVHRLKKASLGVSILVEFGNRAQISLAHFFELLKKQSKGEAGPLLTNGYASIAHVAGSDGKLWAIHAYWRGDGWLVVADSVGIPGGWYDYAHVLSR